MCHKCTYWTDRSSESDAEEEKEMILKPIVQIECG